MKRILSALLLILFQILSWCLPQCRAADNRNRFERRQFKASSGFELKYCLLMPKEYDPQKKYPLVLFLHGAGERGDDNQKQLVHGMSDFASDEIMEKYPCIVVAPQCPSKMMWVDVAWSTASHTMPEEPTPALASSIELVDSLAETLSVDHQRLYITGLSMGGFGTWDAIQRHPHKFAAAVPICGGADTKLAKKIAHVPVWVFHGDNDRVVKTSRSREIVAALKEAGGEPRYTEYPKTGHNSWSATYSDPKMYAWFFEQARQDKK